jgi:hypothetical protein
MLSDPFETWAILGRCHERLAQPHPIYGFEHIRDEQEVLDHGDSAILLSDQSIRTKCAGLSSDRVLSKIADNVGRKTLQN